METVEGKPRFALDGQKEPGGPPTWFVDTVTGFKTGVDFKCGKCARGVSAVTRITRHGVTCECGWETP